MHSRIFKALTDACDLVGGQVIDDDDALGLHLGDEAFFEPLLEDHSRHGARKELRGQDTIMLETGHEC